jgi:general secretion pathway protein G
MRREADSTQQTANSDERCGRSASKLSAVGCRLSARRSTAGLTLVELVVAFTIMLVLTCMAVPLARAKVRVERERALRRALDEMRDGIDKYKDYCDAGYLGPPKAGSNCWPESLDKLVEGVKLPSSPDGKIIKFLRKIPKDPFTNSSEWGLRPKERSGRPQVHELGRAKRLRCV